MRTSQAVPLMEKARIYDSESFRDREEVIIYPREEFKRTYRAIHNHVNDIFLMNHLSNDDNRKLMGHWHRIMERIHIINLDLDSFLSFRPSQGYLDTYLNFPVRIVEDEMLDSLSELSEEPEKVLGVGLDLL